MVPSPSRGLETRVVRVAVLAALFLIPLVFSPSFLDRVGLPKVAMLWVFCCVGLSALLISFSNGATALPRLRLGIPALALLAASALATIFSVAPRVSLRGMHGRYNGLTSLALCMVFAFLVVAVYRGRADRLRQVVLVLAMSSALITAYVFVQVVKVDPVDWDPRARIAALEEADHAIYPIATLGNSNFVGGMLGSTLPFTLFLAIGGVKRWRRLGWLGLAAAQLVAVWLTRSRGGLLAAGAGLLFLGFVHRPRLRGKKRQALGLAFLVAGMAMMGFAVVGGDRVSSRVSEVFDEQTLERRWAYWKGAVRAFGAHPFVGTGPDTFYAVYGRHRSADDGAEWGLFAPPDKPHNIFLEHAATTGVLGLGSYVALTGLAITYGIRELRRLTGTPRLLLSAFLAALAAYLAQSLVSIDAFPLPVVAWTVLAAIAVFADPALRKELPADPAVRGRRRALVAIAAIVLMLAPPLVAFPVLADYSAKAGVREGDKRNFPASGRRLTRAMSLDGGEGYYPYLAGILKENLAEAARRPSRKAVHLVGALQYYQRAQQLMPGNPFFRRNFARAATSLARIDARQFPVADRAWRTFIASDPTNWEPRLWHAEMLIAWGKAGGGDRVRARARAEIDRVRTMKPLQARAANGSARLYAALGDPYWIKIAEQLDAMGAP